MYFTYISIKFYKDISIDIKLHKDKIFYKSLKNGSEHIIILPGHRNNYVFEKSSLLLVLTYNIHFCLDTSCKT